MKLQIVSRLRRVKNETTSRLQSETTENEATSFFSNSNESGMKQQVVSNFNLVNNEARSCFRAQTSQE